MSAMTLKSFLVLEVLVVLINASEPASNTPPVANGSPPANGPPAAGFIPADKYPNAKRDESVEDTYPGNLKVKDPYRWLEDSKNPDTRKFIEDQMAITKPYLESCPIRAELQARYKELYDYPKYSGPIERGKYFFTFRNTGLQNQAVLYKSDSMKDEGKPFIDVNELSKDGTVTMGTYTFTDDGKLVAYLLGSTATEWKTVHFKDVEKGTDLPDKLEKVKYTELLWSMDSKGIFYAGYRDENVKTDGSSTDPVKNQKLYYHLLGTEQKNDLVIAEFPDNPDYTLVASISDCRKYINIAVFDGFIKNLVYVADISTGITAKPQLKPIVTKMENNYNYVANDGTRFMYHTNKDADNYKLLVIDIANPDPGSWKDLVAEDEKNN
ncbi:prolyl endopeptidase-like [Planococcus citri]|uniref:prolyl endopeptidase-like n=1 Tax=Planococcus citri TaxID=170843 RepID=UPI0031F74C50